MIPREDILNELKALSGVVVAVPYVNVFTTENGYFSGIEAELNARIAADNFYEAKAAFTVPQGYFESLAGNILNKIKAEETEPGEIGELSTLVAGIGRKNVYSLPEGYFEELSPLVAAIGKENVYTAPEGYLKFLSPVMGAISRENVYSVPQGYFEQLNFVAVRNEPAKVIKMNPARSMFKYAAAAVITGLLGLTVMNISNRQGTLKQPVETEIAAATSVTNQQTLESGLQIAANGTFDKELNNLSDQEIEQFLSSNGKDVNAALVASSVSDENKLPETTDYFLDENALDNYLKENNLTN